MAKGNFTQKDLMIWTMDHPNGTKFFYVIEKEPFLKDGFKKSVNRVGSNFGDAVFRYLDQAQAELAKWPPGEEEKAVEAAPAVATVPADATAPADAPADASAAGGAPTAADGENEAKEQADASAKTPAPEAAPAAEAVNPKAYPEESGLGPAPEAETGKTPEANRTPGGEDTPEQEPQA